MIIPSFSMCCDKCGNPLIEGKRIAMKTSFEELISFASKSNWKLTGDPLQLKTLCDHCRKRKSALMGRNEQFAIEVNQTLADYMGIPRLSDSGIQQYDVTSMNFESGEITSERLEFCTLWSWLFKVIDKLETPVDDNSDHYYVDLSDDTCKVYKFVPGAEPDLLISVSSREGMSRIEACYMALFNIIKLLEK